MIFIIDKFTLKKLEKNWVYQIVLICLNCIKNNSFINLGDQIHVRIVWSRSNAVKTHKLSHVRLKFLAAGRPVAKTLIKYNSNRSDENIEEEKEPIDIELTEKKKKQILLMMKMLLTLDDRIYKKKLF